MEKIFAEIDAEYKDIPNNEELTSRLKSRIQSVYNSPPIEEFHQIVPSSLVGNDSLTPTCLINLFFSPQKSHIKFYKFILRLPTLSDSKSTVQSLVKLQSLCLTMTYLVHRYETKLRV